MLASTSSASTKGGILQMRNGYFWDPAPQQYFVPRGIAYQIWNPEVGAVQSFPQVEYDLVEFKKMYANSVRGEFVWSQIEVKDNEYDWSKPDFLVAKAEELGLKLFILIGFQYPPRWFPKEWRGINNRVLTSNVETNFLSDVFNFEHPGARQVYRDHIERVTSRYKNSPAIGGWIIGNEYAYFDLWEDPERFPVRRFLGYDPVSQESFRKYLDSIYGGNIAALNANWGTSYLNFNSIVMPGEYPTDRHLPGYHDLIQWRKNSIGDFVALGALAAKRADPNHLITYSMVGGIFNGNDANNTCEDARAIVTRCVAAGAPLDFWSINNYAWAAIGSEMRSADFGIGKYQQQSGLPVMISETGHSSTENLFDEGAAGPRQAKGLPGQLMESLVSGAIGTHFFHWNDRNQFTEKYFFRERGFGIVSPNRLPKSPVYENVVALFRQLQNINTDQLFGGSMNPAPDVQFFWSVNADMGWPRANQENAMMWGALKRLGYQPGIIDDQQFERRDYTNASALFLSRCYQMDPAHLDRIVNDVIGAGIHVHANGDLPGQFDTFHRPNPKWSSHMTTLFGLNASSAIPGVDAGVTKDEHFLLNLKGIASLAPLNIGFTEKLLSWKIWHGLTANSGTTILTHRGNNDSQPALPALQIKTHPRAKSAINTFALGDTYQHSSWPDYNPARLWDTRYNVLKAIYRSHFGMTPAIDLSGPGAQYVISDYRICRNGSILLSVLNEHTNNASITLTAPRLLAGRTVENLSTGGILETNSDGTVNLSLSGDDYVLLYAYDSTGGKEESLINTGPHKIWFESAPRAVWPNGAPHELNIGYDTRGADLTLIASFEQVGLPNRSYGKSTETVTVSGKGRRSIPVFIPDPDLNDPNYASSRDGANYVFHAWLERAGLPASEAFLPVRLLWGVRPISLPSQVTPGSSYDIDMEWEELPSYSPEELSTPLSRPDLWESVKSKLEHYNIVLELKTTSQVIASTNLVTSAGSGTNRFRITVPPNATGPFTWSAYIQTFPNASDDLFDSFEGRTLGADTGRPTNSPSLIAPWQSLVYSEIRDKAKWYDLGSRPQASDGSQSAFMVAYNPPDAGSYAGFLIYYSFQPEWSLPANTNEWKNYTLSVDFMEENNRPCIVEFQLKNRNSPDGQHLIQFLKPYGRKGWETVKASLDQFVTPDFSEPFDPTKVSDLFINVQMLEKNATNEFYLGSFDNIQFDRPERPPSGGITKSIYTSTNDFFGVRIQKIAPSGDVALSWPGAAVLQSGNAVIGPWVDVPRAVSPRTITPSEKQKYYRLRP